MHTTDATERLRILSDDITAHPKADFERISRWWSDIEQVGTLIEPEVTGYGIEMDALTRARRAISEAATAAAAFEGGVADADPIKSPVMALQRLLERHARQDPQASISRR